MLICVGIGPGDLGFLPAKSEALIRKADVIAGFHSVVDVVRPLVPGTTEVVTMGYRDQTERLDAVATRHHEGARCVVVLMGDAHFSGFQYVERVEKACGHPVEVVPGISSAQVLASKTKVCFDETTFITLHRRGDLEPFFQHLVHVLEDGRNAIVIPRPWDAMPADVAARLLDDGVPAATRVEVWEDLTVGRERCWKGELSECRGEFSDMSIMLIRGSRVFPGVTESS